jgi:hypothetical protein
MTALPVAAVDAEVTHQSRSGAAWGTRARANA